MNGSAFGLRSRNLDGIRQKHSELYLANLQVAPSHAINKNCFGDLQSTVNSPLFHPQLTLYPSFNGGFEI